MERDCGEPILQQYQPNDIYNADDTCFYYKRPHNCTYTFDGERVCGSKHYNSKDKLSLMLCTNMTRTDKVSSLVIGKVKYPSALKKKGVTLQQLKVDYYQSTKGWMTLAIFGVWLKTWNEKLARHCDHILLLVDNAPSHMVDAQYTNIKIVFLPTNTTAELQPLDQGIIGVVKLSYCKAITEKVLACIDVDKPDNLQNIMSSLDFVVSCENIMAAQNHVLEALIVKCFHKVDFIVSVPNCPEPEPAPDQNLWDNIQKVLQINIPFEQFATADDNIDTSEDLTEVEIIKRVHAVTNGNKEGEDPDDQEEDDDQTAVMFTGTSIADESEIIHNSAQFLCLIAQQKAYCIWHNFPNKGTEILSEL